MWTKESGLNFLGKDFVNTIIINLEMLSVAFLDIICLLKESKEDDPDPAWELHQWILAQDLFLIPKLKVEPKDIWLPSQATQAADRCIGASEDCRRGRMCWFSARNVVGVQFSLFILHIETYNLLSKIHLNLSIINQVMRGALCTSSYCSYIGFGEFCEFMISATLSAVFCADRGGAVEAFTLTRLSAGQCWNSLIEARHIWSAGWYWLLSNIKCPYTIHTITI